MIHQVLLIAPNIKRMDYNAIDRINLLFRIIIYMLHTFDLSSIIYNFRRVDIFLFPERRKLILGA